MRILPVIDLMHGQVVRGVAGQRASYRPIASRLTPGSSPESIARALAMHFAATELYLADLDAIQGGEPAWDTYQTLRDAGFGLWIDAGCATVERARQLAQFAPQASGTGSAVIAGLESLSQLTHLAAMIEAIGAEQLVFSLDLQQGRPLGTAADRTSSSPLEIADTALACGVRRLIVLDLAGVGMGGGVPTLELCQAIRRRAPHVEVTSGGGVRNVDDLHALAAAGCDVALVASALHDGRINSDQCSQFCR